MLENKLINGIYASQYVNSFMKYGNPRKEERDLYVEWLKSLVVNGERLSLMDIFISWTLSTMEN